MVLAYTNDEIEQYCLNQLSLESTCPNKISDFFRRHNYKQAAFDGLTGFTRVLVPFLREQGIETAYILESSPTLETGGLDCRVCEREH